MLALFTFIITIIGSLNWLCIGFFQFDFVAGLFGTQSSIFSRFVYIIIGVSSVFLTYAVIRYKGRLTIRKNKNQDQVLLNKQPAPQNLNNNNLFSNNQNVNSNNNSSFFQNTNSNETQVGSAYNQQNLSNINQTNQNNNNLNN